jgi:hypothetical protein
MVAFQSRRIRELLGARLEEARYLHFMSLVSNKVAEAFDLDFKAEVYGNAERDKKALAGDVAALSNTAGGLLILGIKEDDQARACTAPGVSVADSEVGRVRQIVAANVVPFPQLDVLPIENPERSGHGLLVIAVPRSPLAPHAVLVGEGLRYPRRNGSTTRYLSEPEVATAYRERFASAHGQVERASQIEQEALGRLSRKDHKCWVVVSLVPDLPGEFPVDQAALRAIKGELISQRPMIMPTSLSWLRAGVGRRRLMVDDARSDLIANYLSAELHQDGAGTFAVNAEEVTRQRYGPDTDNDERWLNDEQTVNTILSGLHFLGLHASDRAGAGGNALVRVRVHPDTDGAVYLGNGQRGISPAISQRMKVPVSPAECVAPLEAIASQGPDLVATAYLLATELFQEFGLPECGQLTRDGQVRIRYWSALPWPTFIQQWAPSVGVTISNETLSG